MALIVELVNLVVLVGLVTTTDPASNAGERKKKGAIAAIVTISPGNQPR